jgi:hypothetical protein
MGLTTKQRHAVKILSYSKAVERVGFSRVEQEIGRQAISKFELATDAQRRGRSESIVADFLSDGQEFAEKQCGIGHDDIDVYAVFKAMK